MKQIVEKTGMQQYRRKDLMVPIVVEAYERLGCATTIWRYLKKAFEQGTIAC